MIKKAHAKTLKQFVNVAWPRYTLFDLYADSWRIKCFKLIGSEYECSLLAPAAAAATTVIPSH